MSAVMQKRLYSTGEAQEYLGLKRRSFEAHIAPLLHGKGVPIGTSIVYERTDIDAAWEQYKMSTGEKRPSEKGAIWGASERRGSTRQKMVQVGKSMPSTKGSQFADVAFSLLRRPKPI